MAPPRQTIGGYATDKAIGVLDDMIESMCVVATL